jgi:hypothetical protein
MALRADQERRLRWTRWNRERESGPVEDLTPTGRGERRRQERPGRRRRDPGGPPVLGFHGIYTLAVDLGGPNPPRQTRSDGQPERWSSLVNVGPLLTVDRHVVDPWQTRPWRGNEAPAGGDGDGEVSNIAKSLATDSHERSSSLHRIARRG